MLLLIAIVDRAPPNYLPILFAKIFGIKCHSLSRLTIIPYSWCLLGTEMGLMELVRQGMIDSDDFLDTSEH